MHFCLVRLVQRSVIILFQSSKAALKSDLFDGQTLAVFYFYLQD